MMTCAERVNHWISDKEKRWELVLLVICLGFYLIFPFCDGPIWCKDSSSYATMDFTREPLYPTLLWIFRRIFGEEKYLMPVVIFQSILMAYAAWKLAVTIKKYKNDSRLLAVLAVVFQVSVLLLNRFVAKRESSYTVSIMTEGVGFPLYVLFVVQLYRYIMERKKRNLAGTACLALLLISLRKQMLLSLCLMAVVFLLYFLVKKREWKRLAGLLLLTILLLFAGKMADRFYNYRVRGVWMEHSGNSMGVLCTLIYTSGEEDAELFEEGLLKQFYMEIYAQADENGCRMEYAPKDWVGLTSHYADRYDEIGYSMINPVIQGYIRTHENVDSIQEAVMFDQYCGGMVRTLLGQKKGNLLRIVFTNTWKGFINSIARVNRFLNIYAALAYLLYMGLYLCRSFTGKRWSSPEATLTLAEIVLLGLAINCGVVGVTIFTQPRYMIYSMGLFYCALSVMLYDVVKEWYERKG